MATEKIPKVKLFAMCFGPVPMGSEVDITMSLIQQVTLKRNRGIENHVYLRIQVQNQPIDQTLKRSSK